MSVVHDGIVAYIRGNSPGTELFNEISALSDDALLRLMFVNIRGKDKDRRGLRLTKAGLGILQRFFTGCEIKIADGEKIRAAHLLYLDSRTTLPWYIGNGKFIIYDDALGVALILASGSVQNLIDIEK